MLSCLSRKEVEETSCYKYKIREHLVRDLFFNFKREKCLDKKSKKMKKSEVDQKEEMMIKRKKFKYLI